MAAASGGTIASRLRSPFTLPSAPASAVRVQGLRRYYGVLLDRPNILRLVRARDGEIKVLAEAPFDWSYEKPYRFVVEAVGRSIEVTVDDVRLSSQDEGEGALADGGAALFIEGGAASTNEIHVAPPRPRSEPRHGRG